MLCFSLRFRPFLFLLLLCCSVPVYAQSDFSFQELFSKNSAAFDSIINHKADYRLQIIYTQINRNKAGKPILTNYTFDADSYYYYCASMVKLPASVLSLEKVNSLKTAAVTRLDTLLIDSLYCDDLNQENTAQLIQPPTISQYIKEMLLVSNNYAFNPLYDFLGQQYFNTRLQQLGFRQSAIANRFSNCDTAENRVSNPVTISGNGKIKYHQDILTNYQPQYYQGRFSAQVGNAYVGGGGVIKHPKDFSFSNYLPLTEVHRLLEFIVFPKSVPLSIHLNEDDHQFLMHCMGMFPQESAQPKYDSAGFPDNYMKYFINLGSEKKFPDNIRVFNKVGQAYGFMTDCSYVLDSLNDVDFFLSCSMYLNKDGVLNDGVYEYDAVGYPFFHNLFDAIYKYELERKRKYLHPLTLPKFSENSENNSAFSENEISEKTLCDLADSMWQERNIPILYENNASQRFHVALINALNKTNNSNHFDALRNHHIKINTSSNGKVRTFSYASGLSYNGDLIVQQTGKNGSAKSIAEITKQKLPAQETQQIHAIDSSHYLLVTGTKDCNQFIHTITLTSNGPVAHPIINWQEQKASTLLVEQPGKRLVKYDEKRQLLSFPYHTKKKIKIAKIHLR